MGVVAQGDAPGVLVVEQQLPRLHERSFLRDFLAVVDHRVVAPEDRDGVGLAGALDGLLLEQRQQLRGIRHLGHVERHRQLLAIALAEQRPAHEVGDAHHQVVARGAAGCEQLRHRVGRRNVGQVVDLDVGRVLDDRPHLVGQDRAGHHRGDGLLLRMRHAGDAGERCRAHRLRRVLQEISSFHRSLR